MSWATATCKCERCGSIFHPRKECYNSTKAAEWEEWAADHITVCGECKEKAVQAKRAEQASEAAENAAASGYPELKGSEKQVAWALRIRQEKAAGLEKLRARAIRMAEKHPDHKAECDEMVEAIDRIMAHDDAGWWIDQRNQSVDQMYAWSMAARRGKR